MPRPATHVLLAALLVPLGAIAPAAAEDLFSVTASGGGTTVTATDSNLLDLIGDAIETRGAFNPLVNTGFTAVARYADVQNAIRVTLNNAETEATLQFPGTGFSRTFVGSDADDLEDEIERFFEEDGGQVYADFLADLNRRSLISVVDGNPFSSTALANEHLFDTWGLGGSSPRLDAAPRGGYGRGPDGGDDDLGAGYVVFDEDGGRVDVAVDRDTGTYREARQSAWFAVTPRVHVLDAAGFDGTAASLGFAGGWWFTDWIGLSVGGSVHGTDYEETATYHSSVNLALPLRPLDTLDADGFGVAVGVTPFVVSGIGGSIDAAAGGAFNGYGGAVNATWGLGAVQITGAAQFVDFGDQDLNYDDFEFETELDQSAVTLGGRVRVFLDGVNGSWWVDAGLTHVEYQEDAAVPDWLRPEIGVGWRWGNHNRVRVSYRDLIAESADGRDFDGFSLGANVVFGF